MPSWKKVIVSGSDASLNSLIVPSITGSLQGTASFVTTASYAVNGGVTQLFAGPNITLTPTTGVGQVTISSTGTGTYYNTSTGSYGSFYDTTTQLNPVANIPRSMSLNTTDITNGVSVSGSSSPFNTYIKVTNAGVYNIQFSAQLIKTDSGTDYVDIWLKRNGVDLLDSATNVTLIGNNDRQVAAWNWFVTAGAGDYYQIMWASADTNIQLLAESATGVHPGIPSVIVTANRIDTFLSNTGSFSGSFDGVLNGTASYATQAATASYVVLAQTASFVTTSETASYVNPLNQIVNISGSLNLTGSIAITGSTATDLVRITQAGSGNAFAVYDINSDTTPFVINSSGSVGIGTPTPSNYTARLIVLADSNGTSGIRATGFGNHAIIGNAGTNYAAVYGEGVGDDAGEYFGGYFKAYQADTPVNTNIYIGAKFEASSDATNYSIQLKDGTQQAGKVLVSQDASGSANWSTQLSGSYALTGSLNMPSIVAPGSSNAKIHVANYPNPPGSLTAGTGSVLYNYGVYNEGLILQYGYSGDQGGIKITDDGVAIFGAGDDDILKVINEDSNTQVFSINDSGYVGINKIGVTSSITPTNAYLDVNGDAIITGSLTVTNNITGSGLYVSGSTSSDLVRITQTGTGNAFVVEDSTNPDATPFVIDATGKVGVGTTTPTAQFEIKSNAQNNLGGLLLRSSTSTTNYPALIYETAQQSGVLELYSGSALTTRVFANGFTYFNGGNVGIGTTTPNAKLDVNGNAIISGSTSTTLLSLINTTTGSSRVIRMQEQLNGEINRTSVRAMTSAGNNGDDSQFNGWVNDHIIEFKSGSGIVPEQLKGWSWSYYTLIDYGFGPQGAYKDVLLISTSNAATLNASLTVTGSTYLTGTTLGSYGNVILIDTGSGKLYYTASNAIGGGSSTSDFPYTGSALITGSLGLTGSLNIYYSGSKNDYPVYITNKTADVAQYIDYDVDVAPASNRIASWIQATATGSVNSLTGQNIRAITKGASGTALGQDIVAKYDGDSPAGKYAIGMMVTAEGGAYNHALRLIDGSQGAGKVLTCLYNNDGFASWVDPVPAFPYNGDAVVDGTLAVTGSVGISGSLTTTSGVSLKGLSSNTTSNVIYIDTSTGALSYGAAISGSVTSSAFPYTGSARITGSLAVTGSISATISTNITSPTTDDSVDILPGYVSITGNDGMSPIVEKSAYSINAGFVTSLDLVTPHSYPKDDSYIAYGLNLGSADAVGSGDMLHQRRYWGHNGSNYYAGFEELVRTSTTDGIWNAGSAPTDWFIRVTPSGSVQPATRLLLRSTLDPLWDNATTGITATNTDGHIFISYVPTVFNNHVEIQQDLQVQGNFVDDDASNIIDNKALIQAGLLYLSNNF